MDQKDQLIEKISQKSNRRGDKLLEFLEKYGLQGLRDATEDQLREYIKDTEAEHGKD